MSKKKSLTVYTDASFRSENGVSAAFWGFKKKGGSPQAGQCNSQVISPTQAEAEAVLAAIRATVSDRERKVVIFTDCKQLVVMVSKYVTGNVLPRRQDHINFVKAFVSLTAERCVKLEWVRGHAGHPENTAVDRHVRSCMRNEWDRLCSVA